MAPLKLHHVAIIQPTEQDALQFMHLLGMEEHYRGYVEQWRCWCIFAQSCNGSTVEFVVPTAGVLAKFNKGVGGLHHIAVEVDNLDATRRELESQGMQLIEPEHVKGAGPFLCNFLSPIFTRGIQVEFVQSLPPTSSDP
ncbi:MAG: VOC family protein [Bradyrhizobium sp.]|uniref:VOC family protein n=1 Tax=Bradyrhizobium sp. TaxID=376 RepID=UPI0025B86658|nr:VOC family protein [Bradyrhizobium sp.]MBI5265042.1 VOC family protein [Bradyrhizobium sp.]